jgi:predicted nucleic-acid-binding Zn-ribbon protein
MTCFDNLVGLRSLCSDAEKQPLYYLDDVEGLTASRLSDLAEVEDGSGKALATRLIESSIRIMQGDIEAHIPSSYQITNNQLANVCSSCNWSGFYSAASVLGTGIIIKNESYSQFSQIIIPSLRVRINNTGSFSFTITDGEQTKTVTYDFVAGQEVTFTNVNFKSTQPSVRIGFNDPAVMLAQVICPHNTSCGCGASAATAPTDLKITGLHLGVETDVQYGFLACAMITCSYDQIICNLVQSSPRLFGLTLLQLVASKAFGTGAESQRVNRTGSFDQEEKKEDSAVFYGYYQQRLKGNPSKGVLGISQTISNNLSLLKDKCVSCNSPVGIAWATG